MVTLAEKIGLEGPEGRRKVAKEESVSLTVIGPLSDGWNVGQASASAGVGNCQDPTNCDTLASGITLPMSDQVAFQIEFAGLSDVGRSRSRNEDSYNINNETQLALVCDGMGGHAGGDIASHTAAEAIVDCVYEYDPDGSTEVQGDELDDEQTIPEMASFSSDVGRSVATIRRAIQVANQRLVSLNQERGFPDGRGMGTTVVGLWLVEGTDKIIIFHAGDSRLYRYRNGELSQLTRDHSLYQAWLDSGGHGTPPHRNIIVRALGTMRDVEPELNLQAVVNDDLYLICSDGLTSMVSDDDIKDILVNYAKKDLTACCNRLIELANERGGHDNVTVILGRCHTVQ